MIGREHKEFRAIDMGSEGWHTPPQYPAGIQQNIPDERLDEAA